MSWSPLVRKDHDSVENDKDMKKFKIDKDSDSPIEESELTNEDFFNIWCKMLGKEYPPFPAVKKQAFTAFQMNLDQPPSDTLRERGINFPAYADVLPEDLLVMFSRNSYVYSYVSKQELLDYYKSDKFPTQDNTDPDLNERYGKLFNIWCKSWKVTYPDPEAKKRGFRAFLRNLDQVPNETQKVNGTHFPGYADVFPEDLHEIRPHSYAYVTKEELLAYSDSDSGTNQTTLVKTRAPPLINSDPDSDLESAGDIYPIPTPTEQFYGWCESWGVSIPDSDEEQRVLIFFNNHLKRKIGILTFPYLHVKKLKGLCLVME